MPKVIEAVYENGVFKPLEKVDLREGERVKIRIEDRKSRREEFLRTWKPLKLEKKLSLEDIRRLRSLKYDDLS
jgi:predicted DNA-binding antitoxin AbrB/MazE fold protein